MDFAALADDAVTHAAFHGIALDYSLASVRHVGSVLNNLHESRAAEALSPAEVELNARRFGAYIGEVMCREFAWSWDEVEDAKIGAKTYGISSGRGHLLPVTWCIKQILAGDQENVWLKFQLMTSDRFQGTIKVQSDDGGIGQD